jgi:predicted dienelactone hydrolase
VSHIRLRYVLIVIALAVLAAACGGGESASTYTFALVSERGAYGVGVTTIELVDTSRPTEANNDFPGSDERRLVVEVWYPADPTAAPEQQDVEPARDDAPYPLIVFAHGLSGTRRQSTFYTQHLASHGYVVAAPDFPLSNLNAPGGPRLRAVIEQPRDVSFLIDQFLDLSAQPDQLLTGFIDPDRIGMTGHSLGGLTTLLTVYGPFRDDRIDAALPISAPGCFLTEDVVGDASVPILVMGGSRDHVVPPSSIRQGYDVANPPRYFVELQGGNHLWFADISLDDAELGDILPQISDDIVRDAFEVADAIGGSAIPCAVRDDLSDEPRLSPERQRTLLNAFAIAFFDAYLRGDHAAETFLRDELPDLVAEAVVEVDLP